jgi:imidazolonepropionase-like amidohydrolase
MMRMLLTLFGALSTSLALSALAPPASSTPLAALRLYLLGHAIGAETASIQRDGSESTLTAHFEYVDRGTTVALDTTLRFAGDLTPLSFESHGKSYRYFSVDASVPSAPGTANTFVLEGMAPVSAQGLLVRYWRRHGQPRNITVLPSGATVHIAEYPSWYDAVNRRQLRHVAIDGVVWGAESLWLDPVDEHVVAAVSNAGVLGFEAADASVRDIGPFIRGAVRDRLLEYEALGRHTRPLQANTFALVGARLIDGTGAAPIESATVVVRDGRIAAAGPRSDVAVDRGIPVVDVSGQTVLPGLWDMHAHAGLAAWGPVYLAAGVTTARDMGGEFDVVTALRNAWRGGGIGPRLLLAGLIDGPGPASFGQVTAANADEGRAAVRRYKAAGFEQIKLYSLLDRATAAAIVAEAHARGMTVTGHIPNGLTLKEIVDIGMDHVAHLSVRGAPGSDEQRDTIAFLKAHGTVIDPTISWSEMLGRSAQTPLLSIQPGLAHVDASLRRLLESASGGALTPEQARERLTRSLQTIRALHDAGVPIVAGTDKGVPGVSVAREIELYVQAGLSPMDAIRAATAVPARVMGLASDSGTIAAGLRADLIVVEGNPLERISDIRNVALVSANGRLYDTGPLWRAGGFQQ